MNNLYFIIWQDDRYKVYYWHDNHVTLYFLDSYAYLFDAVDHLPIDTWEGSVIIRLPDNRFTGIINDQWERPYIRSL